jgi:Arc/MetJ-type ribon-helix-helix transcriptional regulator
MNITLSPELQKFVEERVKAGEFQSPAQVVEAGLARLMLDPPPDELDKETLAAIERAEAQLDRGEGIPLKEAFDRLRKKHLGR